MQIAYKVESLGTDDAWDKLAGAIGNGHPEVVQSIFRHLRILDVKSYILEEPYIDRDYSADYLHFYARTFRTYPRHCKRAHFFSTDISSLLALPRSTEQLHQLRGVARRYYCGFCVIRPLPKAPIGRTVLRAQVRKHKGMEPIVTCRAEYKANLLGMDIKVSGTAYIQQDARVGACAQVSIWAAIRHLHTRYGYNWVSVADITHLATPTGRNEANSLPAGSDFLTSDRILQAIREAGYQPLCFDSTENIAATILPYVESGIPVILGLNIGNKIGHAVTVIGRVFAKQNQPTTCLIDYVPAFIVHDDQSGPYMSLPVKDPDLTPYSFGDDTIICNTYSGTIELSAKHATFAVSLMSPRVFSTAAAAEVSAHDRINDALSMLPDIRQYLIGLGLPTNEGLLTKLQEAHADDNIVLRTYLTSAAGYRRHIADGTACDELKDALLKVHLPHFTWVTEIATIDSYNYSSVGKRRIHGHTIIDATATGRNGDGLLALHLPGLLFTRNVDSIGQEQENLTIIEGDNLYQCRTKNRQGSYD